MHFSTKRQAEPYASQCNICCGDFVLGATTGPMLSSRASVPRKSIATRVPSGGMSDTKLDNEKHSRHLGIRRKFDTSWNALSFQEAMLREGHSTSTEARVLEDSTLRPCAGAGGVIIGEVVYQSAFDGRESCAGQRREMKGDARSRHRGRNGGEGGSDH